MYMGTAAISSSDYVHACIDHADLILMVGHDVVEKPPFFMRPATSGCEGTRVVHINYFTAQVRPQLSWSKPGFMRQKACTLCVVWVGWVLQSGCT